MLGLQLKPTRHTQQPFTPDAGLQSSKFASTIASTAGSLPGPNTLVAAPASTAACSESRISLSTVLYCAALQGGLSLRPALTSVNMGLHLLFRTALVGALLDITGKGHAKHSA